MDIEKLKADLRKFVKERDWDQFHSAKNLVMALSGEAGELVEIFQWLTEEQSNIENLDEQDRKRVQEELADIFIYLIRISDKLDIDIASAVNEKMKLNDKKYPIELSKGNATKYNRRKK